MATPADTPADAPAGHRDAPGGASAPEAITLLLVRHGMTDATGPRLAGRAPGIHLNDVGRDQASRLAGRLAGLRPAALVSSPLERCQETAEAVAERLGTTVTTDDRFVECDYGSWTGRTLTDLSAEPLWRVVQDHPSAARFPGGEALATTSARAVEAVRDWNGRLLEQAPPGSAPPVYVVCGHGDVIKAIIADALGMHLDLFQRLRVDPCSVTSITYTRTRPFLNKLNDTGEPLAGALPTAAETRGDAAVGGGAGQSAGDE
ncbi:MSMEG_4193 family putative phosphomutase [Nocardiopsis sp. B62]|uniref:MSMEG_4193 family putative phosphomutase n=1 Tax=Nocardiopsis sp. B62 TaxID=2824874 RepID=UPI001B3764E6|nr:MSMEG_4193 family putative phosphomutase [Nocardiopsis sp. B62]MBQ1083237.1 MSMEG_4193 family putative phosphomutase [Nocardiopsis sp. B62]